MADKLIPCTSTYPHWPVTPREKRFQATEKPHGLLNIVRHVCPEQAAAHLLTPSFQGTSSPGPSPGLRRRELTVITTEKLGLVHTTVRGQSRLGPWNSFILHCWAARLSHSSVFLCKGYETQKVSSGIIGCHSERVTEYPLLSRRALRISCLKEGRMHGGRDACLDGVRLRSYVHSCINE